MKKKLMLISIIIWFIAYNSANAAIQYRLNDLGTFGFESSRAVSINNHGVIAGESDLSGFRETRGFQWNSGKATFLGPLIEDNVASNYASPAAINDKNEIAGTLTPSTSNAPRLSLWGADAKLKHSPGMPMAYVTDLNNKSQYVASADTSGSMLCEGGDCVFIIDDHEESYLQSQAYAINDQSQVAGVVYPYDGNSFAYLWENDNVTDLNDLVQDGFTGHLSSAEDINNKSQIIGNLEQYGGNSYLFSNGDVTELNFDANAINNNGQIIGKDVLYEDGQVLDLNKLITSNVAYSDLTLYDLNDSGQLVGSAMIGGVEHAVLLNPVPIPAAVWLLGTGLFSLAGLRYRFNKSY